MRGGAQGPSDPRGTVGWALMAELLAKFQSYARPSPPPQLQLYSAHDTTLVALWSALGLLSPDSRMNTPDFAQSVVFELRPPPVITTQPGAYLISMKVGMWWCGAARDAGCGWMDGWMHGWMCAQ